jgi:Immunity protein 53
MESELARLQHWYSSQCDGDWEHQYGIRLETIDNPGWHLSIDLCETPYSARPFDKIQFQGPEPTQWYFCKVEGKKFEAACGPECLTKVIDLFLAWTER